MNRRPASPPGRQDDERLSERGGSGSELLPGAQFLPPRGLDSLRAMVDSPASKSGADDFAEFVRAKVKVDVAQITAKSFEIDLSNKYKKKTPPSKALEGFSNHMSTTYKAVFDIYSKKLRNIFDNIPNKHCAAWKSIEKLCSSLNIDIAGSYDSGDLQSLLARLRSNDMTRKPL